MQAAPVTRTRSPASSTVSSPPRADSCFASRRGLPRRSAQNGASVECAEPVTGSSGMPDSGPNQRLTKSYGAPAGAGAVATTFAVIAPRSGARPRIAASSS